MGSLTLNITMNRLIVLSCLAGVSLALPFPLPYPQAPVAPIPIPGADGYGKGDGYFQYINVPAHKTFEWGYRRGNPDHNREEYLSQKDHTFKAKLKWHDGYDGHGEHYFDFNHGDAYAPPPKAAYAPKPSYAGSEPAAAIEEAPAAFRN